MKRNLSEILNKKIINDQNKVKQIEIENQN